MKFVTIDIETTGLDESYCQILEVAAIVTDYETPIDQLPMKRWRIRWNQVQGEPFALRMNAQLIADLVEQPPVVDGFATNYIWLVELSGELRRFFKDHGLDKPMLAGKNVSTFDMRFLNKIPGGMNVHRRVMDPGPLYFLPGKESVLPDTKECIKRAGIEWDSKRLHSAIDDCKLVIELLRRKKNG